MKLKDCTKAELIFVIKRLQMYSLSDGHYIQLALRGEPANCNRGLCVKLDTSEPPADEKEEESS